MELSESLLFPKTDMLINNQNQVSLLTDLKHKASNQLEIFSTFARKQLAEFHIEIPPAISLVNCPNSALSLANEHPQAEKINNWLAENLVVQVAFKEVELLYEMIEAVESDGKFIKENQCFHIGFTSAGSVAYFAQPEVYSAQ